MRRKLGSFPVTGFGRLGRRLRFVQLALAGFRAGETLFENTHQVDNVGRLLWGFGLRMLLIGMFHFFQMCIRDRS